MTLLVGSIFHMTRKIVSEMTYNVSMGTLNPTIPYHTIPVRITCKHVCACLLTASIWEWYLYLPVFFQFVVYYFVLDLTVAVYCWIRIVVKYQKSGPDLGRSRGPWPRSPTNVVLISAVRWSFMWSTAPIINDDPSSVLAPGLPPPAKSDPAKS